jgi:hypothetical protein
MLGSDDFECFMAPGGLKDLKPSRKKPRLQDLQDVPVIIYYQDGLLRI